MSIVIFTHNQRQSKKWQEVLSTHLPYVPVEIYPDVKDRSKVTFLVCWKPPSGILDEFVGIKGIQSLGAGVDHIFDALTIPSDIQVSKVVDHNLKNDMWEHALSVVLNDIKNLDLYANQQAQKIWKPKRYQRLSDLCIGVLGLGTIGSHVAHRFALLGCRVVGWSQSKKDLKGVESYHDLSDLKDVLSQSDFVVNILPLTQNTRGIINYDFMKSMKNTGYLINVGRGPHQVDKDLIRALDENLLRGASLDVFHNEPLGTDHPFWSDERIKITPHIASLTHISSVYQQVVKNYDLLTSGQMMQNLVDVHKGY